MRTDTQATLHHPRIKAAAGRLTLTAEVTVDLPLAAQDGDLPGRVEAAVADAGQQLKRQLYALALEHADAALLLDLRQRGEAFARRGRVPATFKTVFGTVRVWRGRVRRPDGRDEIPAAAAWQTPRQVCLTAGLRDAACDAARADSVRDAAARLARQAGEDGLIAPTTVLAVLHAEGERLRRANRQRAEAVLRDARAARPAGPAGPAAPPAGFPGAPPAHPAEADEGPRVDPGWVVVQADEVKVKAQAATGRKAVWVYTAVVLSATTTWHAAAASAEELWAQVRARLSALGVPHGRRLLVLADGAGWIRSWFEGLGWTGRAMVLCWYHLAKRCEQLLSLACRGRDHRDRVRERVLGYLWEGRAGAAIRALRQWRRQMKNARALDELIGYLAARRPYLPDYGTRRGAGLWIASNRVEKFNDWGVSERCKGRGMAWTPEGVCALAVLEAARRNGELETWRREHRLEPWPRQLAA